MESLQSKHQKERRDLQSQLAQKRKTATKKSRKAVNEECALLEQELRARHAAESELSGNGDEGRLHANDEDTFPDAEDDSDLLDGILNDAEMSKETANKHNINDSRGSQQGSKSPNTLKQSKPNRQKARMARRAAEQEAIRDEASREAESMPNLKARERAKMLEEIAKRNLIEHTVAANGHCLYLAVADQLHHLKIDIKGKSLQNTEQRIDHATSNAVPSGMIADHKDVRASAADYMSRNPDGFAPFLEEPVEEYAYKVRNTAEWGGQLELLALAKTYNIDIHVLQGDGRVEKITSEPNEVAPVAWLAYYKHGFGLGEHYNSLRIESK